MATENQLSEEVSAERPSLYVVEDDLSLQNQYEHLAKQLVLRLSFFSSGKDLLALDDYLRPCCLVLELSVDNESGEDLQVALIKRRVTFPIIINTRFVDVESAVRVMERGAITVLRKPTFNERLKKYVQAAVELDKNQLEFDRMHREVESLLGSLTERQRHILDDVVEGMPTKAIARKLEVSDRLVENERSEILRTFGASSTPDVTLRIGQFRILDSIRLRIDSEHKGPFRPMTSRGTTAERRK